GRGDAEHLRGGVHGRHVGGVPEQPARPGARAAGEFEHASGRPERIQRLGQLITAGKRQPMLVVLGSSRPIVCGLLVKQLRQIVTTSHPSNITKDGQDRNNDRIATAGRRCPITVSDSRQPWLVGTATVVRVNWTAYA